MIKTSIAVCVLAAAAALTTACAPRGAADDREPSIVVYDEAADAALSAYLALQTTYDALAAAPNNENVPIDWYSDEPLRTQLHEDLAGLAQSTIVHLVRGQRPAYSPQVVSRDLHADLPEVKLSDCPDRRGVVAVFEDGRDAEPGGGDHQRHPLIATVWERDGRWMVADIQVDGRTVCQPPLTPTPQPQWSSSTDHGSPGAPHASTSGPSGSSSVSGTR